MEKQSFLTPSLEVTRKHHHTRETLTLFWLPTSTETTAMLNDLIRSLFALNPVRKNLKKQKS